MEELVRKASLLTEEERSQFSESIDLGETTIEEFEQLIGAMPLDEAMRRANESVRQALELKKKQV